MKAVDEDRESPFHPVFGDVGRALRRLALLVGAASLLAGCPPAEFFVVDVERPPGPIAGLPEAWEGEKIVAMGDWQLGLWLDNDTAVRRAVEKAIAEEPAAVLLLGDFVYKATGDQEPIEEMVTYVKPLVEAGIPTYAVLGNHDWAAKTPEDTPNAELAREVERRLEETGVTVLRNEAIVLEHPDKSGELADPLYLVGIGSLYAGEVDIDKAFDSVPQGAPRIVIVHEPDVFERLPEGAAPLTIAGHTHGGQVRIPGLPDWSWMALRTDDRVTSDGWIESDYGAPGNRLYVNRGIGFSLAPIRFACPPELTVFTLRPEASRGARKVATR